MPEKQAITIIAAIILFAGGISFFLFFGTVSIQDFNKDVIPQGIEMQEVTSDNSTLIIYIEGENKLFYETSSGNQKIELPYDSLYSIVKEHIDNVPDYEVSVKASAEVDYPIIRKYIDKINETGISRIQLLENE